VLLDPVGDLLGREVGVVLGIEHRQPIGREPTVPPRKATC
jgi:hypothetical protein